MKSQLLWAGHIVSMPDHRLPKKLLFGELQEGKRSRGAPKKRFKDSSKASLKTFTIDHFSREAAVYEGAKRSEASRTSTTRHYRQASATSSSSATIPWPYCPSLFYARTGLTSHLHTHLANQTPHSRR